MSSLEKRQASRRGSAHGRRKCSDGVSDASSVGSFIDDTDREVSSLTDRAFRSLCIGEDAIYNDLEVSSPADQHKACLPEAFQKEDLRTACYESSARGIQDKETERKPEVASTFQHSRVDVAQAHAFKDESLHYISNGSMEATWQQNRSTSRVSSLIKALGSGESYSDSGAPDTLKDKYQDFNNESWDKSALLSIQRELTEFSSGYNPNFKSGPLQSYGNHFHAAARLSTATSAKTKFKSLNTTNPFFHSELSPFQLWKDYNRFPFEPGEPSGFVSAAEFPKWYDSPLYKELAGAHRIASSPVEGGHFTRWKNEDVAVCQRSRSSVIQKASAVEKRCESEMSSNCPPWKNNFVRNKLPSNRPSTVSPTNEKAHRPDSSLLYHSRHSYEMKHNVSKSEMCSRTTPFNITQLLTPVIPGRQDTDTSEILQFAHTPVVPEHESDLKAQSDAKQLRDSYKAKASSLLFNLKDNRKRVKSTYSPTKFKALETADGNKHPPKLDGCESRLSEFNREHSTAPVAWDPNPVQQNYESPLLQTADHHQYIDKSHDNMNLVTQYATVKSNIPYLGSPNIHPDVPTRRESEHYRLSTNSGIANSGRSPVGYNNDSVRTPGQARQETESFFPKHPASLSAEMASKQPLYRREDACHQNFGERNTVRHPSSGYMNNQVTEENLSWKRTGSLTKEALINNNNNMLKDAMPFKGEIAALIEMDKQRKATAKQYLPSANDSVPLNKAHDNINMSWISNDANSSIQTYVDKNISNKQAKEDLSNTNTMLCEHRRSDMTTHEKPGCPPRGMKHAAMDIETERDPRMQFLQSMEEKYHYNEGSVAYQPYKYESNKQWHIATADEGRPIQRQQSEMKAEQPGECNYIHSLSRASCVQQQSAGQLARTRQRNWITEDGAKSEEHKQSRIYHKQGDVNKDLKIPTTQRTLQSDNAPQARGDRFNISDILSVRDNEQAKRIKENKHFPNGGVGERAKLENLTSPVTSDASEDTAAKTEPSKVQSHALQDGVSWGKHEHISYGYIRKESHIPNDVKERLGKGMLVNNEHDKTALRALSYKEKGQTKQEMLTSKLKAHAQKEISAIKEKGLAKHGIPSRAQIKQGAPPNIVKGQSRQDVLSPKKEITAEKLNHLFQDITYSSVSLPKEERNQGKGEAKSESLHARKVDRPTGDRRLEKENTADEMTAEMIKPQEETIPEADQKCVEDGSQVKEVKSSNHNQKERSTDGTNQEVSRDKESVIEEEDKISSVPCTSNIAQHTTCKENGKDSPKHDEAANNNKHLSLYNVTGKAVTPEFSINKAKEHASNVNTDSKCYDLEETTTSEDDTRKETSVLQQYTPSDWTKDEAAAVEESVNITDSKRSDNADKQLSDTEKQEEHRQSGDGGGINENQTVLSEMTPMPSIEVSSKPLEPRLDKQGVQTEAVQTANAFVQQKPEPIKTSRKEFQASTEPRSSEESKYSLQQEAREIMLQGGEMDDVQETTSQFKRENQNQQVTSDKEVTENNAQQLQQDAARTPPAEHHNQTDFRVSPATQNKQSSEDARTFTSEGFDSTGTEQENAVISVNSQDQQPNTQPTSRTSEDVINPASESHVIHIASKEDGSPMDEPVIYSICVSRKSEAVSEDEPIIFSISVSSLSDASIATGPDKQEQSEKHLSVQHKDPPSPKNKDIGFLESKVDSKEVSLLAENTNVAEQESVVRKNDSPASKDKLDYYRSTEVDNISSCYGSAKYVLPNGDTIHLESDETRGDEKKESTHNSLQRLRNNPMDIEHGPEDKVAGWMKNRSPESPVASPKPFWKVEETHERCFPRTEHEHQSLNEGGAGVAHSEPNTKDDVSAKREKSVCEDIVEAKQIVANGKVDVKENKQVAKKGETEARKKDRGEDKSTATLLEKCENHTQRRAGSLDLESHDRTTDLRHTASITSDRDGVKSHASTVRNIQSTVEQTARVKSRSQEELENDALRRDRVSSESGDNEALQNSTVEFVGNKSDFAEVKYITRNEGKASKVISIVSNEPAKDNNNPNQIKQHGSLKGEEVQKHENQKAEAINPCCLSENAQTETPAKFAGAKTSSVSAKREVGLGGPAKEKWKGEPAPPVRETVTVEIPPINPGTASCAIKAYRDARCESGVKKCEEENAPPQDRTDETLVIENARKNKGGKDLKPDAVLYQESEGEVLGGKKERGDLYQPKNKERNGSTHDGIDTCNKYRRCQDINKDTNKSEVTQKEKKITRPEISALADYARLRVISAEDDTITEKDLLQKMNTTRKYNLASPEQRRVHLSVGDDTEQRKQLSVTKKPENLNTTARVQERGRSSGSYKTSKDVVPQSSTKSQSDAHPNLGSLAKTLYDGVFAIKDTEGTKEKALRKNTQSDSQSKGFSRSHEVAPNSAQLHSKHDLQLKRPSNASLLERRGNAPVSTFQSVPQASIEIKLNDANKHVEKRTTEEVKGEETTEELQYFIVNAMETEAKPKDSHEPPSLSHVDALKKEPSENNATSPHSCAASPAMGKPVMFRVKDNTAKPSSVTKTVRPHFRRSFSEEFGIGSPVASCCGAEKAKAEYNHESAPKESPVFQEQSVTSHQLSTANEIHARNKALSPGFVAPKEPRSYNRRSHMTEEDESPSLSSAASGEGQAANTVALSSSRSFGADRVRHTYERPESACYERPESACSDIRPSSKPPSVPPKTEKALRRAQRLTTRRIKKVEDKMNSETPSESKSIRTVSSLPSSPMVHSSTPQSVHSSPVMSQYHAEPTYTPPAPSIVAHSFPMTQRRLLQDPNSGQIFMVDMPVQVKTKTFFDPETGKYLQLNVRQRAHSASSQPASVEVLGPQYVVYPGFLPMSVSVSSPARSSSHMSAPAALPEAPNHLKANPKRTDPEICEPECPRNVQQHDRPPYRTHGQTGRELLHNPNIRMTPRQTHIITMSELEDFAMENT